MWKLALLRAHIPLPATVCNIHLHLTINNWHLKNHSQRSPLGLIHKLQKNTFDLRCWVQLMMQNASNNPTQTSSYDIYSFPDLLILNKKNCMVRIPTITSHVLQKTPMLFLIHHKTANTSVRTSSYSTNSKHNTKYNCSRSSH